MSEFSSGGDCRKHCLLFVLKTCVGHDKRLTKDLANTLKDEDVVEKEAKRKWIQLVREDQVEMALEEMLDCIFESKEGIAELPRYLQLCEVPKNVIQLMSAVVGEEVPKIVIALICKWSLLVQREEDLKREIPQIFPEDATEILEDWPLNFINFCTKQTERQEVQAVLRGVGVPDSPQDELQENSEQADVSETSSPGEPDEIVTQEGQGVTTDNAETEPLSIEGSFEMIQREEIPQTRPTPAEDKSASEEEDSDIMTLNEDEADESPAEGKMAEEWNSDAVEDEHSDSSEDKDLSRSMEAGQHEQHREYRPDHYQDDTKEDGTVTAGFFAKNRAEIRESRLLLSPVVKLTWPTNENLIKEDEWPEMLIQVVTELNDHPQIRSIASVFQWLLDKKKTSPDIEIAAEKEGPDIEDWFSTNLPMISGTEERIVIFKALLTIAWPESEMLQPIAWDEFLVKERKIDENKFATFVSVVQTLITEPLKESALPKDSPKEEEGETKPDGEAEAPASHAHHSSLTETPDAAATVTPHPKAADRPAPDKQDHVVEEQNTLDVKNCDRTAPNGTIEQRRDYVLPRSPTETAVEEQDTTADDEGSPAPGGKSALENKLKTPDVAYEGVSSQETQSASHKVSDATHAARKHKSSATLQMGSRTKSAGTRRQSSGSNIPGPSTEFDTTAPKESSQRTDEKEAEARLKRRSSASSEISFFDVSSETDPDEFVLDHEDEIIEYKDLLLPVVKLAWPGQKVDKWPDDLYYFLSEKDELSVKQFMAVCKIAFRGKQKQIQSTYYKSPAKWIGLLTKVTSESRKSCVLKLLYELTWKEKLEWPLPVEFTWKEFMKQKWNFEKERVKAFIPVAEIFFELVTKSPTVDVGVLPKAELAAKFPSENTYTSVRKQETELSTRTKVDQHENPNVTGREGDADSSKSGVARRRKNVNAKDTKNTRLSHVADFTPENAENQQQSSALAALKLNEEIDEFDQTYQEMTVPVPPVAGSRNAGRENIGSLTVKLPRAEQFTIDDETKHTRKLRPRHKQPEEPLSPQISVGTTSSPQNLIDKLAATTDLSSHPPFPEEGDEMENQGIFTRQKVVKRSRESTRTIKPEAATDSWDDGILSKKKMAVNDATTRRQLQLQSAETYSMRLRLNQLDHKIIIRVAVKGIQDDEIMCLCEPGNTKPWEMQFLCNDVFSKTLDCHGRLEYRYAVYHNKKRSYRYEDYPGFKIVNLLEKSTETFIFDEATFLGNCTATGSLINHHLPLPNDELLRSEFLKTEISSWLHQMQLGWSFLSADNRENKISVTREMVDFTMNTWLSSLQRDDKLAAALCLVLAFQKRAYVASNVLQQSILACLDITALSVTSLDPVYGEILALFNFEEKSSKRPLERLERAMVKFLEVTCADGSDWLLAVPLFYLVKQDGHVPHSNPGDVFKGSFLPCRAGCKIAKDLKPVWTLLTVKKNEKNYQERLEKLSSKMLDVSEVRPWMIYLYQYLLNLNSIQKMILDRNEILERFQIDRFVEELIPYLEDRSKTKVKFETILETVEVLFIKVFERGKELNFNRTFSEEEVTESLIVMSGVLKTLSKAIARSENGGFIVFCVRIACHAATWSHLMTQESKTNTLSHIQETISEISEMVMRKIDCCFNKNSDYMKFLDAILRVDWYPGQGRLWKEDIQSKICCSIDQKWKSEPEKYMKFFMEKIMPNERVSEELKNCFEIKAIKCAQVLLTRDQNAEPIVKLCGLFTQMPRKHSRKVAFFEKLFLAEYQKYQPCNAAPQMQQILKFVCEWPLSTLFFQTFNIEDALQYMPKMKPKFKQIEKSCERFLTSIDSKEVRAEDLNLIKDHRSKICEFLRICTARSQGSRTDDIEKSTNSLFSRMERFKVERKRARAFMNFCTQLQNFGINVDVSKLNQVYEGINDSSPLRHYFTGEDIENNPSKYLGLTRQHLREFALFEVLKKSNVFNEIWGKAAKNYKSTQSPDEYMLIDWKDALTEIFAKAKNAVHDLTSAIIDGSLKLNIASNTFEFSGGCKDIIRREIKKLHEFTRAINRADKHGSSVTTYTEAAIEQIWTVFELKKNSRGLKWVLDFKKIFELVGNFAIIDDFPDWESNDMVIGELDENVLQTFPKQLKEMTQSELDYLRIFTDEVDLIDWLKNTKMTDVSEIKVLYDLVTSSPGETPHETDRVMYLLNAAQGFAPLLFHLDEVNCLEELMQRCTEVRKNIQQDPKIVDKWRDSAKNLEWFTEKERLYGSDQKQCLRRVKEINERGVYTIGRISQDNPTQENTISLTVRAKENASSGDEAEIYTLDKLQDLQSRLMLIAGEEEQGQLDIQQFVDLFTTVKTVQEAFLNLVEVGCMLFSQWTAVIGTGPPKQRGRQMGENLHLTIHFMKTSMPLGGPISLIVLQDLSRAFRNSYEEWTDYIASKRLEHYYLNEYNIQQITYLCHQLAITGNKALLPDQVLTLLSKDSKCLVSGAIQDALNEAVKISDDHEDVSDKQDEPVVDESKMTDLEKKKRAIRVLVNREGLDEDLAKAAVQAVGDEDIEECNNWALLNQFDEQLTNKYLKMYEDENDCALQSNEEEELTTVLENRSVRSLKEMIDKILETEQTNDSLRIVGAVKTICHRYYQRTSVLTLQDYLSIEHLGRFLAILHEKYEVKEKVERSMMSPLEIGQPNLIVCQKQDTLPLLLSLYMKDLNQPLPTTSEVFLCSKTTCVDEVERFMRRAMCKCKTNGRPIFCLAFTHKLKFNVSQAIENIYNELKKKTKHINDEYQLVLFTSRTGHYISGCFEKQQIPRWPTEYNAAEISEYLKIHLHGSHGINGQNGNSLVKIITSNRSGVGKSLFVKKLTNQMDARWYEANDRMTTFLKSLNRQPMRSALPNRNLPEPLTVGKPNLILFRDEEAILPSLLSIFMKSSDENPPTASEVLLSSWETTEDEVERFMRRAICQKEQQSKPIFVIAYPNRLRFQLAKKIMKIYNSLSANAHAQNDHQFVIMSTFDRLKIFNHCNKYQLATDEPVVDQASMDAYLLDQKMPEVTSLKLEVLNSEVQDNFTESPEPDIDQKPTSKWNKTTVRLLKKQIDLNHVLRKLCGQSSPDEDGQKEEIFRNEDNHLIHIDLTPAVEKGIEHFMFNLIVLGRIYDDEGRVWNRQSQHLYLVEVTRNDLNKVQLPKNSIVKLLPCVRCLSPTESLEKYGQVKQKTMDILRQVRGNASDPVSFDLPELSRYLDGEHPYKLDDFHVHERNFGPGVNQVDEVLRLSDIPNLSIARIVKMLPEEAQRELEDVYKDQELANLQLMDYNEFMSTAFQRPYQYLKHADVQDLDLDEFQYSRSQGTPRDCIEVLQKAYGSQNASWAQLRHFSGFLNIQLQNCEESVFCQRIEKVGSDKTMSWEHTELQGLKEFAVKFMIRMAQDFATPSLDISDQSSKDIEDKADAENIKQDVLKTHQIRRRWEEKCHPYIFFNEDRVSMSFINVDLNRQGDLLDEKRKVLAPKIASKRLLQGLHAQGFKFGFDFENLKREEKLQKLCTIMGLPPNTPDPDKTYELTTENVLKILAIYMRLRCNIPVIVMGETGCGKTRMVEFMSKLRAHGNTSVKNMVTLKIHGGVTAEGIYRSVRTATKIALSNKKNGVSRPTVLFYDEANTTTAIHAIKEVLCDSTIDGESFHESRLQIVAACNPYKSLSENAIKKLENLGLGYRVEASKTSNCLGNIPMRRLVYKVVALPPSMQPFVWDFGQLSVSAEQKYIRQMTVHLQQELHLGKSEKDMIDFLLFQAQSYMKKMKDECRYVSLRDVERCLKFFKFFHQESGILFPKIQQTLKKVYKKGSPPQINGTLRCLLQTLGVCYHVSLDNREEFRRHISNCLEMINVYMSEYDINEEFIACQNIFLTNLKIDKNIARNEALRENVFLITICMELQIPLFLVGKPGSSKSLAKTIVADNMEGSRSKTPLYRRLKQVYMVSYQCSALTDAAGIESIFIKAAELQKGRDLKSFAAVVVLDEIGLAEDSPNMPLKILHPLLECGSTESGTISDANPDERVGFVGISNWALDPAKMNRGIFVTRSTPSEDDLLATAKAIMQKEIQLMDEESNILEILTKTYLKVYNDQKLQGTKEYFGLRDYYSLIKMVNVKSVNKEKCELQDVARAVQRNFSGGQKPHGEDFIDAVKERHYLGETCKTASVQDMITENLGERDTRFLLLLTSQQSSVSLLEHIIQDFHQKVQVIYGSSFPGDHTYTEICKNINRIKVCMETGRTVVLLDMTEVHESLYDALNQHYSKYGGQKYVDIGLGGHRLKCRVADSFRLIVLEQKDVVYKQYPIPLINRLEKHHLVSSSLLSKSQKRLSAELGKWATIFSRTENFKERDAFIGFHDDTISSIVISCEQSNSNILETETCKKVLLQSAAADAIFRSHKNHQVMDKDSLLKTYTEDQVHDSLLSLLDRLILHEQETLSLIEVTSFSNILTETDRKRLETTLQLPNHSITLLSLQQFDTQQDYMSRLDKFFSVDEDGREKEVKVLLIQCPQAQQLGPLLACAKYSLLNSLKKIKKGSETKTVLAFLHSTRRQHADDTDHQLVLQHTHGSRIVYVDDLRPPSASNPLVSQFYGKSIADVLLMGAQEMKQGLKRHEGRVNFLCMLKDTVCQAMAVVKRNNKTDERNLLCVNFLNQMCQQHGSVARTLMSDLAERMANIYEQRDRDFSSQKTSWIIKEAGSAENLQEGGTFGKTLCLCLKRHLADLLAFIISAVDENNNLDFLLNTKGDEDDSWQANLWLQFFEVFNFEWVHIKEMKEFSVGFASHLTEKFSPRLPFSFALNELVLRLWDAAGGKVRSKAEEQEQSRRLLFNQFRDTPFAKIIERASESNGPEIKRAYATDIIRCLHNFGKISDRDQEALSNILLVMAEKLESSLSESGDFQTMDIIPTIFYTDNMYYPYLCMMADIFRVYPGISDRTGEWIKKQNDSNVCIVHSLATIDLLDWVAAYKIEDDTSCVAWMELTQKCKNILTPYQNLTEKSGYTQEIAKRWKPMSLLDLLLLRLLPSRGAQDESFTNYVKVVVSHARRLLGPLKKLAFGDKDFLRILLNVLRKSCEDIELKFLVSWQDSICKGCRKTFVAPIELPCRHFICKACAETMFASADMRRQCPLCPTSIPQEFARKPAELSEDKKQNLAMFKANCTSFFLEYLEQFCFLSAEGEMSDQVQLFFYEMVVGIPVPGKRMELETLAIDLNITTRASILHLLLKHHAVGVEDAMNELLYHGELDSEQKESLIVVIFSSFELTIPNKSNGWREMQKTWKAIKDTREITLETLRHIAKLRYSLHNYVKTTRDEEDLSPDSLAIVEMCNNDKTETLKSYIVKLGCQMFGTNWFDFISSHNKNRKLVPKQMRNSDNTRTIDYWILMGERYIKMRETLNTTPHDEWREGMQNFFSPQDSFIDVLPNLLAVANFLNRDYFTWVSEYMAESNSDIRNLLAVIRMFKDERIPGLLDSTSHAVIQLLILSNCIVMCKPYMMENFLRLSLSPQDGATWFWPAMPVSVYISVRDILAHETDIATYTCPNGHPYVIGECTKPWDEASCPDCGETIGGKLHQAAPGNQRIENSEEAEAGYQLKSDPAGKDDPSDRISKQCVAVVHFILHSCLLVGLNQDSNAVCGQLKENSANKAKKYLYRKLQDNVNDLSNALGRNYDDAVLAMNECLLIILAEGFSVAGADHGWTSTASRVAWEDEFRRVYMLPVFRDLDKKLMAAQQKMNSVEDLQSMMLYRLTHEISTEGEPETLTWNHPMLWKIVKQSNAAHLLQTIRDSASTGGVLKVILESPNLHLLENLDKILKLQGILISKFQDKKDLVEVDRITFKDYKKSPDGYLHNRLVDQYIELWNSIYEIFEKGPKKQMQEYLHEIDENSPITMALPSPRGRGICAKILAEYLIDIHNHFLENCSEVIKPKPSTHEVKISQFSASDHIIIDKQKHRLFEMIRLHTSYTIAKDSHGTHHQITYDIDALEKKVREKYVTYKPRIKKKSLPCIKYPQDIGIGSDWTRIRAHIHQVPLPDKISREVDDNVSNQGTTPADVCEGVRTLTHAISFLAKIHVDEKKTLQRYLEDTLLLSPNHMVMIPKSALICHTLDLYQRLMWHKAMNFVQQGLNPYKEALYRMDQSQITDVVVLTKLKEAFGRMDIGIFQRKVNEMLIRVPDFNPNWSLTTDIFPDLEFIDDDNSDAWYGRIPEEICFKHVSHLFQLSVKGIDITDATYAEV